MDAAAIKCASELFQAAADLPRRDRPAFLRSHCRDDALLRFVEQMLADHEKDSGGPLDVPLLDGVKVPMAMPALPTRLGAYELVRVLGEGGMAAVYEARQQNPSRVVALKVLRPGVLSGELLKRFQHEIQVLGQLQHEGIAHIYEADVAEAVLADGSVLRQPFYAMELIRGEPLNVFAQTRGLSDAEKLELVAKVCDAVQYAHQRGVIHRDLKPANILVEGNGEGRNEGTGDGRGDGTKSRGASFLRSSSSSFLGPRPKVLDFGVARVMGAEVDAPTMNTEAGRLIGTLAYMSPEQVGGHVEETDTRSDVYSLGVILYELLAGKLPHDLRDVSLPEAARRVREDEPARLATLDRRFKGDIDVIVARAMSKDKSRRYASALELALDIRRHLAGEAIEARRDSAIYVLRKGLRRHRAWAAAATVLLLGLVAFAVYASVQAHRFEQLSGSEHRARVAAESVNKFLGGVIELANPDPSRGYAMTLTDMLDDATHRLEKGEISDPDVEAQVRETLAKTYDNLELTDGVIVHQLWLADYHKRRAGEESKEYLEALTSLGNSYVEGGHEPEGQATLKQALELAKQIYGEGSFEALRITDTIGNSLMREGKNTEALAWALPAAQGIERLRGPDSLDTGFVNFNLGGVYRNLGQTDNMARCYEKALAIMNAKDPGSISTIRLRRTYANDVLRRGGRLAEAQPYLERALAQATKSLGADHPETISTQSILARTRMDLDDLEGAKRMFIECLDNCRNVRRWAGPTESDLVLNLVLCLRVRGEWDEAAECLRITVARFEKARGRTDPFVLMQLSRLSGVERERGNNAAAAKVLEDMAQRVEEGKGPDDPRVKRWRGMAAELRGS